MSGKAFSHIAQTGVNVLAHPVFNTALLYGGVATLWIALLGAAMYYLTRGMGQFPLIELSVGLAFVSFCTAVFLFLTHHYRNTERELRLSAQAFDSTLEMIVMTDAQGRILAVNRAFTKEMGYQSAEVLMLTTEFLRIGTQEDQPIQVQLASSDQWQGELSGRHRDGTFVPLQISIRTIRDERSAITNYVIVASDVSEQKFSETRIHDLAYFDVLTGLPNRALLQDRGAQAIAASKRNGKELAVLYVDIDHFKDINESFGHAVGDELLREVAKRLKSVTREADTVSHWSGDQFVIVQTDSGAEGAAVLAQNILNTLAQSFPVHEHSVSVGASIGISVLPRDGNDFTSLLRNADTAAHQAKEQGRHIFRFFHLDSNVSASERLFFEGALRQALAHDEFVLHYQPQLRLSDNSLTGFEALIRWRHPELGLVSPARFIPLAERRGLITDIGLWVMREACRQNQVWRRERVADAPMAVNLSAAQLASASFADDVQAILSETGLPASRLEIELTESLLLDNAELKLERVQTLKRLGVSLAIDDFGTGYSSLSYLKRLPVAKLKIDQSFVRDICSDGSDQAIAEAIISMGQSLRLTVIAEGVETHDQRSLLKQIGCNEAQGYLFARPMPAEEIGPWLENQEARVARESGKWSG